MISAAQEARRRSKPENLQTWRARFGVWPPNPRPTSHIFC